VSYYQPAEADVLVTDGSESSPTIFNPPKQDVDEKAGGRRFGCTKLAA
jgi:hypothetical protein